MNQQIKEGSKVTGTYCGKFQFSGTVDYTRCVMVPTDGAILFGVKLDAPIEVYGDQRDSLAVYALPDGSPSSYTRYTDSIRAEAA